jgi:hypothetical protein
MPLKLHFAPTVETDPCERERQRRALLRERAATQRTQRVLARRGYASAMHPSDAAFITGALAGALTVVTAAAFAIALFLSSGGAIIVR